jgi:hypothetical protein
MSRIAPALLLGAAALLPGCDYTGDWLFPQAIETVPGIQDLGTLEPVEIETLQDIRDNVIYGEIGATGNAQVGGATFQFDGTGGTVCVWVDPETVYWSQSVAATNPQQRWAYPDNFQDDGDIDLYAGVSAFYSGSPGVEIGNFEVRYQDALGNTIPVEFNECFIDSAELRDGGAHAGRGMAEFCDLTSTQEGAPYTVVLENFSVPLDDNRIGYGLILIEGSCDQVSNIIADEQLFSPECVILGESIDPRHDHDYREDADGPVLAVGQDAVEPFVWEGSTNIESLFCASIGLADTGLRDYCLAEAEEIPNRDDCEEEDVRCYCGDIRDTPSPGAGG